jgi:lipoyl(octanoyl) transferase
VSIWRLIRGGSYDPYFNMAFDEARFLLAGQEEPSLRFFYWFRPSITIGYLQKKGIEGLYSLGIPVVRRPTGGRAVYHDREVTYSIVLPPKDPILKNTTVGIYAVFASAFLKALKDLGLQAEMSSKPSSIEGASKLLCFGSVSQCEVTIQGKKVIGSAQRRAECGFIQQGSILLDGRQSPLEEIEGRTDSTYAGLCEWIEYKEGFEKAIEDAIIRGFEEELGIEWVESKGSEKEYKMAEEILNKMID